MCEFKVNKHLNLFMNWYILEIIHKQNSSSQLGTTVNWNSKSLVVLITCPIKKRIASS